MSLWERVDLPVLRAINELSEHGRDPSTNDLATHFGFPRMDVERSLRRLHDNGYVAGVEATSQGEYFDLMNIRLLERGLEVVQEWPVEAYDDLLAQLRQSIEEESDHEVKSRLRRLLDGLTDAGRDIAVSVLSEWAKKQSGL
jgi:DNA-binding MarR family transcriptional regulator